MKWRRKGSDGVKRSVGRADSWAERKQRRRLTPGVSNASPHRGLLPLGVMQGAVGGPRRHTGKESHNQQQKQIESVNLDNSPTLGNANCTRIAPDRHLSGFHGWRPANLLRQPSPLPPSFLEIHVFFLKFNLNLSSFLNPIAVYLIRHVHKRLVSFSCSTF